MAALLISLYVACVIAVVLVVHYTECGELIGTFLNISGARAEPPLLPRCRPRRLSPEERKGFLRAWQSVRARFERDPKVAIVYADLLLSDLLLTQNGSSAGEHAARRSVGVKTMNGKYQVAHKIARSGGARILTFDELERAMNLYASLFDDLFRHSA